MFANQDGQERIVKIKSVQMDAQDTEFARTGDVFVSRGGKDPTVQ